MCFSRKVRSLSADLRLIVLNTFKISEKFISVGEWFSRQLSTVELVFTKVEMHSLVAS